MKKMVAKKQIESADNKLERLQKEISEGLRSEERDLYTDVLEKVLEKTKKHAKEKTKFLQTQFKEHSSTAIIAALSFVIGLTWKDFILKIMNDILKPHIVKYPYLSELVTAIVVTIFAIVVMAFVSKWAKKPNNGNNNSK